MAKVSTNPITSLSQDWGNDTSVNMPFSGAEVQRFIKSYLGAVAHAAWFNPADYKMYWFASENDSTAFQNDNTRTDLVLFSTAMSFASELFRVLLQNNTGTTTLNVATNETNVGLSIDFAVQKKAMTDVSWSTTEDGCYVSVFVDAGSTGTYVTEVDSQFYRAGTTFSYNIRPYLIAGQNRVKVQFVSESDDTVISSLVYSVTMSEMYIELMNNQWYIPIVEGGDTSAYKLGGFKIVGALSKTLHLDLYSNSALVKSFTHSLGTSAYATVPFSYSAVEHGFSLSDLNTSVYLVDAYLTSGTLTSPHIQYNIMYVAASDIATAQLVAINETADMIYNYTSSNLFKYSIYNKGLSVGSPAIVVREVIGTTSNTVVDNVLSDVATGVAHDYSIALEWFTEESLNLSVLSIMTFGNEQTTSVPVDNSLTFPPTSGFNFYLNAATRFNSNVNKLKLVNLANSSELTPVWTRMAWADGIDGWTADPDGRKALYLPAGSYCRLPYSQYQMIPSDGISLEFCYKVRNVSDYDEPIITISSGSFDSTWRGIRIKPTNVTVHSSADSTSANDLNSGTNMMDEKVVHLIVTVYPNFKGNSGKNLVTGYINGCKNFQFSYENGSVWATDGDLVLGSSSADLSVYFIRAYRSVLSDTAAQVNYISSLGTVGARQELATLFKSVMNATETEISYESVKDNNYNYFVLEMLNGATVPSRANGWDKEDKGRSNLEMHFGEHPEWDWKLFNIETMGQGTTSMNYYRWNLRWRIDKTDDSKQVGVSYLSERVQSAIGSYSYSWGNTAQSKTVRFDGTTHPAVKRITAKINSASSMQSHKIGATRAFSELHDAIGLKNEAQDYAVANSLPNPSVAVYQYPAYGFAKVGNNYTFIGLFTIGPDKGDKPTFGWDLKNSSTGFSIPEGLISLEGTDHERKMVMFNYPWNSDVTYLDSNKCINIVKATGDYDKGWEVGNCHDLDVGSKTAAQQSDINNVLDDEFKPAYELVFNNSTMLAPVSKSDVDYGNESASVVLENINNNIAAFHNRLGPNNRASIKNYQIWIEDEYDVYYYDIKTEQYVSTGINLITQNGTPTGDTLEEKNEWFKQKRRERFMANAEDYWHIGEAVYHFAFMMLTGSMDNFGKNSYPYKMKPLADGGRWRWRQDDLDSMAGIGNLGMDNMPSWMEFADTNNGAPYFGGSESGFWNLINECYMEDYIATSTTEVSVAGQTARGILSTGQAILSAMASIAGVGGGLLNGAMTYIKLRFWDNAQNYFPQSAYNADAAFKYEAGWLDSGYGGVSLAQSLGNHYEAEYFWFYRRLIYMMSYFKAGPFGSYANTDLGRINFRPYHLLNPAVVPSLPIYPAFALGTNITNAPRTWAGDSRQFNGSFGDGQQDAGYMATNYLLYLGDWKDFTLSANYVTDAVAIQGNKLTSFKVGDAEEPVTTNIQTIIFPNNYCLLTIDARNASSISGVVDLSNCTRLRSAYFGGTSITGLSFADGQKIETVELPDTVTSLVFRNHSFLTTLTLPTDMSHIELMQIRGCQNLDVFEILHNVYTATNSRLKYINLVDYTLREVVASRILELVSIAEGKDYAGNSVSYGGVTAAGAADANATPTIEGELRLLTGMHESSMASLGITTTEDYGDGLKRALASYFGALYIIYDPVNIYMTFQDSLVESILASNYGSTGDTGISLVTAQGINSATFYKNSSYIFQNTAITTFNELAEFNTGITTFGSGTANSAPFKGCSSLVSFTVPNNVKTLNRIGSGCTSLTTVTLPSGMTTIGASAFEGCNALSTINLPPTLSFVGNNAFKNCANLVLSSLPASITSIGTDAFSGCSKLTGDINLPNLTSISGGAFNNSKITSISNLGSITNTGGWYAFSSSTLVSIVLPATLTTMTGRAFSGCSALTTVTCLATTPPTYSSSEAMLVGTVTNIYVPADSVEEYQAANGWSRYASKISAIPEE